MPIAQRVGFFNIRSGVGQNTGYRVQFGSGRSDEIYKQVFPGIFFNLGYFGYFRVSGYIRYLRVFTGILVYWTSSYGGSEQNIIKVEWVFW